MVPFQEVQALAKSVAASKLFSAFSNPDQALVLMLVAQAEGCHPIQAVQRYDIIQGKPAKKSDAMLADFQQRGGKVSWTEYTDEAVEAEFTSAGMSTTVKVKWTYKQAEAAGLTGKATWKQYKRQMLKARVISEGVRISDPGVVAGLYTPEEVGDMQAQPVPTVQAPMIEQPAKAEPPVIEAESVEAITPAQLKAIQTIAAEAKIGDGLPTPDKRAARIAWLVELTGRQVSSTSDLTKDEASKIIDAAKVVK